MIVPGLQGGSFQGGTVSYTSSRGAAATLSFQGMSPRAGACGDNSGSAIFVYGPTGPQFGTFQVQIDGQTVGMFNSSTTISTFDTLLFFASGLDGASQHIVVMSNEEEGKLLAIDYATVMGAAVSTMATGSALAVGTSAIPSGPVFPTTGVPSGQKTGGGSGTAGAAIGISVGVIAALVSLVFTSTANAPDDWLTVRLAPLVDLVAILSI